MALRATDRAQNGGWVLRVGSEGSSNLVRMSQDAIDLEGEEELPPVATAHITYTGPVAPHWEISSDDGDPDFIDAFRTRVMARLTLLPPHDPQFRRNRDRVNRDAETERITVVWNTGMEEQASETRPREHNA